MRASSLTTFNAAICSGRSASTRLSCANGHQVRRQPQHQQQQTAHLVEGIVILRRVRVRRVQLVLRGLVVLLGSLVLLVLLGLLVVLALLVHPVRRVHLDLPAITPMVRPASRGIPAKATKEGPIQAMAVARLDRAKEVPNEQVRCDTMAKQPAGCRL
jgi:hypothetical protein